MLQYSSDRYKKISMTKDSVKDPAHRESQKGEGGPCNVRARLGVFLFMLTCEGLKQLGERDLFCS